MSVIDDKIKIAERKLIAVTNFKKLTEYPEYQELKDYFDAEEKRALIDLKDMTLPDETLKTRQIKYNTVFIFNHAIECEINKIDKYKEHLEQLKQEKERVMRKKSVNFDELYGKTK